MDDLKYITYQGQGFDQSAEAWYTFPSVGFQQRNKLTNQRAPNEINVPTKTTNNKNKKHTPPHCHTKIREDSRKWHLITCTHD